MKQLHEYFHVNDNPVKVVDRGPAIRVDSKWKMLAGAGLSKSYKFEQRQTRDEFVVRCMALETYRGKQDIVWTIEDNVITVFLKMPKVGLTESITEFARILDDLRHDLEIKVEDVTANTIEEHFAKFA